MLHLTRRNVGARVEARRVLTRLLLQLKMQKTRAEGVLGAKVVEKVVDPPLRETLKENCQPLPEVKQQSIEHLHLSEIIVVEAIE